MSVAVVVPSRSAELSMALLDSLAAGGGGEQVVLVDNGSPGAAVARLTGRYPFAEALRLEENAGYSRAVNLGVELASAETVVLLNDDCVCEPGFVERLAGAVDPEAGVPLAAGVLRQAAAPELIDTAGMQLDRTLLVYDYLNGRPIEAVETAADPLAPSAAAAAVDRATFIRHGGFDERLFAYWEDVDLFLRILREGGRCVLARDAIGTHAHSATLGAGSREKHQLMGYGRGFVLRRWRVATGRRLPAVLARELPIVIGQAVLDRTLVGARSRVRGWRSVSPEFDYPAELARRGGGDGLATTLIRRLRRRASRVGGP